MSEIPKELIEARELIKNKRLTTRSLKYDDNPNLAKYESKKEEEKHNLIDNPESVDDYVTNILYYKIKFRNMTTDELKAYKKANKLDKLVSLEVYKNELYSRSIKIYYEKIKERKLGRVYII